MVPGIAALKLASPAIHGGPHRTYRVSEADEQRLPDHVIADVELDDFRQRRDLLRGGIIKPVTGMDFEARGARQGSARDNALPFGLRLCRVTVDDGVAPGAGVNFNHRRAQLRS